ncbi:MAG: UDP-N-acetylmuramoyl-L-alanyl-D-glutamate--2,6-diaminopimelate ligase [Betaproteobacteria bacterium]|nr:UDP-N-acetylmuramoyl-L-alanyl-D-glutamate--2,6-diaminopimelate ligase [Betaproteobacteria bacterium]
MRARARPALSREALDIAGWLRSRIAPQARLCADSRRVRPGDAFFAWPGHVSDGRAYLVDARARGAAALVVDDAPPAPSAAPDLRSVTGLRDLAGEIAASWHGEPAAHIDLIAVTGTNGKTSCSQWIAQGLARGGRRAAVIGTLGSGLLDAQGEAGLDSFGLTTPDALTLHALLAAFVAQGADSVVMEASSIGLDQSRLSGTQPAVAVFTNLSRDHLDYHGSLEAYAQAKLRLFRMPGLAAAVLNAGDALSVEARAALPVGCRVIAYGEAPFSLRAQGVEQLLAEQIIEHAEGLTLTVGGDFGRARVDLPLLGRFNAFNALAVAGAWLASGVSFDEAMGQLAELKPVPGRLERVRATDGAVPGSDPLQQPCVVVDYAHTPDALTQTLAALRPVARARGGSLWCVFGAGGDRDAGKRPLMGAAAEAGADHVVLTSDNPRSEDPERIVAAIEAGMVHAPRGKELDRARAIGNTLSLAGPRDVVLIAGKGHERWQELAGQRIEFSDVVEARRALLQGLSLAPDHSAISSRLTVPGEDQGAQNA